MPGKTWSFIILLFVLFAINNLQIYLLCVVMACFKLICLGRRARLGFTHNSDAGTFACVPWSMSIVLIGSARASFSQWPRLAQASLWSIFLENCIRSCVLTRPPRGRISIASVRPRPTLVGTALHVYLTGGGLRIIKLWPPLQLRPRIT